jgi:hypothetical protein
MVSSSLLVTRRRPELELPLGVEIKEALVVSRPVPICELTRSLSRR